MYTFTDRGDRSLTLRPEGTAPICRAYVEHGMHREPQPVKLYTVAPMYRYAAPQKGRFREHWQLSVEAIGSDDPALDAEVIQLYTALARRARRDRVRAPAELDRRRRLSPGLRREAHGVARRSRRRAGRRREGEACDEPAARLRRQESGCAGRARRRAQDRRLALRRLPRALSPQVRATLDAYGVPYTLEPTLVRGLDYYTRTAFEFVGPEEKAQSAICSGGRYDGLIEEIGGPPTPGIGFGAGIERALLALENEGVTAEPRTLDVFFVLHDLVLRKKVLHTMAQLRANDVSCDTDYAGRSPKGQLDYANRLRVPKIVIAMSDQEAVLRVHGQNDVPGSLDEILFRIQQ